jgi:hypothetical protein
MLESALALGKPESGAIWWHIALQLPPPRLALWRTGRPSSAASNKCTDLRTDTFTCLNSRKTELSFELACERDQGYSLPDIVGRVACLTEFCPNTAQHLRRLLNGWLTGTALRGGQGVGMFSVM